MKEHDETTFASLGLTANVLRALDEAGYSAPTPIQAATIPALLEGRDVLGQAQTGTGKTAAFSLPALCRIDFEVKRPGPAMLVLVPTRELAMQVADAVQSYGQHIRGARVVALYGGASYTPQLRALKSGAPIVVGTPGRIMDHMRRGTLDLSALEMLVLDEADEMLKMGFAEDVEWIVEHAPEERQIALFSATMPAPIKRIANQYLRDAEHVVSERAATSAETIEQLAVVCPQRDKLDVLAQLLLVEQTDGVLVFVRTRALTTEVAKALGDRGHHAAALSGELGQPQRERLVQNLRSGRLNVIVATDVAARGLDVKRISHVINFDLPPDTETYVHRIGRTGRAGRAGRAILFVTPRAKGRLNALERDTRQKIEPYRFPSQEQFVKLRHAAVAEEVATLVSEAQDDDAELKNHARFVQALCAEDGLDLVQVASAALYAARKKQPIVPAYHPVTSHEVGKKRDKKQRDETGKARKGHQTTDKPGRKASRAPKQTEAGMERYRVEVGRDHGVEPRHLVGAIANEAGLRGKDIGRIDIQAGHTFVDLPEGMPKNVLRALKRTWVLERPLQMTKSSARPEHGGARAKRTNKRNEPKKNASKHPSAKKRSAHNAAPSQSATHAPKRMAKRKRPKAAKAAKASK